MSRPVTEKNIIYHNICKCGCNDIDHTGHKLKIKVADLLKGGMKRRKNKTTGNVSYLMVTHSEECFSCNPHS